MCNHVHGKLVLIVGNALICQKWYLGALLCEGKMCLYGQVGAYGHAVALRGQVGAVAHVQPSAWEVDFDCWECSHMPKLIFGSLIVCGAKCVYADKLEQHVHAVALRGAAWGPWHMFNQVHGELVLIVGNALICQK
ncbi:hypothetical protein FNV43_RR20896 [Rhamnella rubrinervis]|uniref:Uncharacterized protein n=1 Tax=Rhamnella rubrinervis TaxID=2594499 RepID=A0A8K0DVN7_9ROSA|nr:hypothetical protein FNV43_RR20896 [Rhamnella rubrinervis]